MTFKGLVGLVGRMRMTGTFKPWDAKFYVDPRPEGAARIRAVIWVPNGYRGRRGKTNVALNHEFTADDLAHETPASIKRTVRAMVRELVIHEMDECFYVGKYRAFNPHRHREQQ